MEIRLIVAAGVVVAAAGVAWFVERRRSGASPFPVGRATSGPTVPERLTRGDFDRPDAPWLVVLFSSATCDSCLTMSDKVAVLGSEAVATCEVEYPGERELHDRYAIDSVPLVVVADIEGKVRAAFLGNTSATDLWAAVAELRTPRD